MSLTRSYYLKNSSYVLQETFSDWIEYTPITVLEMCLPNLQSAVVNVDCCQVMLHGEHKGSISQNVSVNGA